MVSFMKLNTWIGDPSSPGTTGCKKVKCGKLCAMVTIFGQKNHWCKLRMMMTFVEVKGQKRSNTVNNALWLQQKNRWCKLRMMMTFGGQRSTEVKYSKQRFVATKLGQKNCWCKLTMMMTFAEVKGQQRSYTVCPRKKLSKIWRHVAQQVTRIWQYPLVEQNVIVFLTFVSNFRKIHWSFHNK